jgi:hypothetical protein
VVVLVVESRGLKNDVFIEYTHLCGCTFCMGEENVWESVVRESRERERGRGESSSRRERGRPTDGKAGHDSYQRLLK